MLSRQNLPVLNASIDTVREGVAKGAYTVSPASKEVADALLIATGSEVSLAIDAQKR